MQPQPDFGPRPDLAWVDVAALDVDHAYQRDATRKDGAAMINRVASAFCWRNFQPLTVARRDTGQLFVVDGQHRLAAAIKAGAAAVPCAIFASDALADEAATFVAVNSERMAVKPLAIFHAALLAGDAEAVALNDLVVQAGLAVARHYNTDHYKPGEIMCLQAVRRAVARYGRPIVLNALTALREAFVDDGTEETRTAHGYGTHIDAQLVGGVVEVYAAVQNEARFDPDRLIETIGALDAADWRVAARPYRELHKLATGPAYRAAIIDAYNRGLHERNRLPKFAGGGAMIAEPIGEIRLAVATLRHLVKIDQADRASLNTAFALIDEHLDEIEVQTADGDAASGVVRLPILTLADIGRAGAKAAAARRAGFTTIDGGRP